MTTPTQTTQPDGGVNKLYFAAWRWHFYAGLFVLPFLSAVSYTHLTLPTTPYV